MTQQQTDAELIEAMVREIGEYEFALGAYDARPDVLAKRLMEMVTPHIVAQARAEGRREAYKDVVDRLMNQAGEDGTQLMALIFDRIDEIDTGAAADGGEVSNADSNG